MIYTGDCLDVLRTLPADFVDAIVTDPPYGLSFMGKKWDYDVPSEAIWRECLRVLKPGGHLLAFAGTRTQHRMAVRIEDAGFEIRDMIAWVYGSGFPKSHNLKEDWQGWGTALKPALEPITVARKPLIGTVAENVLAHGTGALNVDGCRVGSAVGDEPLRWEHGRGMGFHGAKNRGPCQLLTSPGRWPANLIHDGSEEVVGLLNDAARFFYCAKASKADRDEGCEGMELVTHQSGMGGAMPVDDDGNARDRFKAQSRNHHPTVKPTDLMRYLCRLVTPPGGTVLDPFMGSGSTGKAAMLEGFDFIGIERDPEYVKIAEARIGAARRLL
jgi:site-specific DNA-methyltransferase (adenine-specific)